MRNKHLGVILAILTGLYWLLIQQIISNQAFFEKILPASVLASVFSYTIYKFFIRILRVLFNCSDLIKKIMLGNKFLHGNWVGYYIGESGNIRYVHEEITQTYDEIIISGKAYDKEGNVNSRWDSESVNLNEKMNKLVYTYNVEGKNNNDDGTGIVKFSFSRRDILGPKILQGFYIDLQYGERREIYEKKINIKTITREIIIDEAKNFYKEMMMVHSTETKC